MEKDLEQLSKSELLEIIKEQEVALGQTKIQIQKQEKEAQQKESQIQEKQQEVDQYLYLFCLLQKASSQSPGLACPYPPKPYEYFHQTTPKLASPKLSSEAKIKKRPSLDKM